MHTLSLKSLFTSLFFILFSISISAQVNSPYSRIGLGNIFSPTFTSSNGMGQLSVAQFAPLDIQYSNPASYSYLFKSVLDIGASANFLKLKTNTEEFTSGDGNLAYFAFGFSPDNKRSRHDFGFSTGLIPFSGFQYDIQKDSLNTNDTLIGTQSINYRGEGMLYQFYTGFGYNIDFGKDSVTKAYRQNIGAGLNLAYLFGNLQNITVASFPDAPNSFSTKYIRETSVGGGLLNAGLSYQKTFGKYGVKKEDKTVNELYTLNAGLSYSPSIKVNGTQSVSWFNIAKSGNVETIVDTLLVQNDSSSRITIPSSFNIGLSLNNGYNGAQKTKFSVGLEYATTLWSQFEGFQYTDSLANSQRIKIGAEITPISKQKRNITYRLGFYTGKSNLVIDGEQLNEFGVTLGAALPLPGAFPNPRVNVSLTAGRRGVTDVIQENYLNFNLSMNLNDFLWFQRRQLQ